VRSCATAHCEDFWPKTRQSVYVLRYTEGRSAKDCLSYPAGNSHLSCVVLNCHLWPVRLYNIFPHYSHKRQDFRGKKLFNIKVCFLFSLQCFSESRAWGSAVVKLLRYYSEGPRIDPRSCHWGFFPRHLTSPCARGRLSPLEMSTRIFLGIKTAGA
jgi:hypothetical protein